MMFRTSKGWRKAAVLTVMMGAVVVAQTACSPAAAQLASAPEKERTISVSGSGTISARPDTVVVRLGVETTANSAEEALSENGRAMEAVVGALTEMGVPDEQIQTQTVQLQPRYQTADREPGSAEQRELVGYVAENVVEARSENLDGVGALLDGAVEAGANRIDRIRFEVSGSQEFVRQAREAAWEDAESKAQQLADLAGDELGQVVTVNESSRAPRPVGVEEALERETAVPIQPGTNEIQVDLQVTWALR